MLSEAIRVHHRLLFFDLVPLPAEVGWTHGDDVLLVELRAQAAGMAGMRARRAGIADMRAQASSIIERRAA